MLAPSRVNPTNIPGGLSHAVPPAPRTQSPLLCLSDYGVGEEQARGSTHVATVHLGGIDLVRYGGMGSHRGSRQLHHVREDQSDDFLITIPIDARIDFNQQGYSNGAEPGTFVILSTATPFSGSISSMSAGAAFSALHMRIAGSLLRGRVPHIDACCDRPLPISRGTGNIMRGLFDLALAEGPSLTDTEVSGITSVLADAVAMIINETPPLVGPRNTRDSRARIHRRALAHIEENLSKQGLNAESIGEHCRVSERYIQAVFSRMGTTVVSVVRDLRLDRCRADLENPTLRLKSVTQVAMSWGFNDLAYFSRAFRQRFGFAPSVVRSRSHITAAASPMHS